MLQHLEVDEESSESSSCDYFEDDDMDERSNIVDKLKSLYALPTFKGLNHLNRIQSVYSQKMKENLIKLYRISTVNRVSVLPVNAVS